MERIKKMKTQIQHIFFIILFLLSFAVLVEAANLILATNQQIPYGNSPEWNVNQGDSHNYLQIKSRIWKQGGSENPGTPTVDKNKAAWFYIKVGSTYYDIADYNIMMNVYDSQNLTTASGAKTFWINYGKYWRVTLNSDYDSSDTYNNQNAPRDFDGYTVILDISKYKQIIGDTAYKIGIKNLYADGYVIHVDNITLLDSALKVLQPDPNLEDVPNLGGIPAMEQERYDETLYDDGYTAELTNGGGILVTAGDDVTYKVESKFSSPRSEDGVGPGYRYLRADNSYNPESNGWTSDNLNGNAFEAHIGTGNEPNHFQLVRTMICKPHYIEVHDEYTNCGSSGDLAVIYANQISEPCSVLDEVYMSGLRLPTKKTFKSLCNQNMGNPTIYVTKNGTGVGLMAVDDVYRARLGFDIADGNYQMTDLYMALPPDGDENFSNTYTVVWRIYPTVNGNYFEFINTARRDCSSNYTIDGGLATARWPAGEGDLLAAYNDNANHDANLVKERIERFSLTNNVKYILLSTLNRLGEDGNREDDYTDNPLCHGTGWVTEQGVYNRKWMYDPDITGVTTIVDWYKLYAPGMKRIPYIDPWLSSEYDVNTNLNYDFERATRKEGSSQPYSNMQTFTFIPFDVNMPNGSYAKALYDSFFAKTLPGSGAGKMDVNGFYMDESTFSEDTEPQGFGTQAKAFTYNIGVDSERWDGVSGDIAYSSTFCVTKRKTHSGLISRTYRNYVRQQVLKNHGAVWNNFAPASQTETNMKMFHFHETRINNNAVYVHLTTPMGLGNNFWERTDNEQDIAKSIRYRFLYGGLYIPYGQVFHTDRNVFQDMYPATPVELNCGYVINREKIHTMVPGKFSFSDDSKIIVRTYDPCGLMIKDSHLTMPYPDWYADFDISLLPGIGGGTHDTTSPFIWDQNDGTIMVGNLTEPGVVRWNNADYNMPANGSISISFKMTDCAVDNACALFAGQQYQTGSLRDWFLVLLYDNSRIQIKSRDYDVDGGATHNLPLINLPLTLNTGNHQLILTWNQKQAGGGVDNRERIDISVFMDDNFAGVVKDANWIPPGINNFQAGCWYIPSSGTISNWCGREGIKIDDVAIYNRIAPDVNFSGSFKLANHAIEIGPALTAQVNATLSGVLPYTVRVGDINTGGQNAYLKYENGIPLAPSGSMSIKFKLPNRTTFEPSTLLMTADVNYIKDYMWVGLSDVNTLTIKSHSSVPVADGGGIVSYDVNVADLDDNTDHTLVLCWQQTRPYQKGGYDDAHIYYMRERANIEVLLDSVTVMAKKNISWTKAGNTKIAIGSLLTNAGGTASSNNSGKMGILIDQIDIYKEYSKPAHVWQAFYSGTAVNDFNSTYGGGIVSRSGERPTGIPDGWVGSHWGTNGGGVRVGNIDYDAALGYTNINNPLPASGSIRIAFDYRNGGATCPTLCFLLTQSSPTSLGNVFWFGMLDKNTVIVKTRSAIGSQWLQHSENLSNDANITIGKHEMILKWKQRAEERSHADPNIAQREKADIRLYLDGNLLISKDNIDWTKSGNTCLQIGGYRDTGDNYWCSTRNYVDIDDIEILNEPNSTVADVKFEKDDCAIVFRAEEIRAINNNN